MDKNIKSDVIISYISMVVSIILTFFLTKVEVEYLGKDTFGILGLVNSTIGYISILELGVGQTVIKYIAQYKAKKEYDEINKLAGHSLKIYIIISCIGLVLGLVILMNSGNIFLSLRSEDISIFNICFFISLINILLQIPATTFQSVLSAYNRFKFIKILNLIRTVARFFLIFVFLKLGFGIVSVFIVTFVLMQLSNISMYFYSKKYLNLKISFKKIDKNIKKELSSYSFFVFLFLITDQIFWKTDSIVLGIISTTSVVAVYSISGQIVMQLRQLSATFSSVFLPRIIQQLEKDKDFNEINKFYTKASKYQYIIISLIVVSYALLGKEFITLWVGEGFINSYYYSMLIIIATIIPMSQTTNYQIMYAMSKHKLRSVVFLISAVLNIILSIVLYYVYGAIGVALATALAMIISDNVFMNLYYKYISKISLFKFFKEAFLKTTIVNIILIIIYMILNNWLSNNSWITFMIKGLLGCVSFLFLVFIIVLDNSEKEIVKSGVKKFIKK